MPFRVTQNIINNVVIQNLNRNLYSLLKIQSKLSSGKRLTRPSDDPIGTATAIRLRTRLSETQQFLRNMDSGETQLNQTDTVFDDMSSLLMRAQELAINQANVTADYRTREAVAQEVNALISQFVDLLNTRIGNRYIFGGFETLQTPFLESANGLKYTGDSGITNIEIESGSLLNTSVPGSLLLPTAVDELGGHANLHPYAERSIPLAQRKLTECNLGTGVDDGFIQITTAGGKTANIDLTGIENLGEVVFRLNSALDTQGARLKISARLDEEREAFIIEDLTPNADRLPDQKLTVKELSNGRVARQLGILGEDRTGSGSITGRNLSLLKLTTRLQDLNRGSGVELGKFQITDRSGNSAVVDISGAQTLVDVRELINAAGTNLHAYINTGGNGIMIVDESPLSAKGNIKITEYGENTHTARDLGILTTETGAEGRIFTGETLDPILSYDTPVVLLNRGQGFDLKTIRVENGPETGVIDLSKASTIGGIIQTINESGLDIKAEINDLGTGISIVSLVGGRTLRITNEPRSYTASLLGIEGQRDTPVDPVTPLGTHSNLMPALTGETRLGDLNGGQGVAPGLIRITDMMGSAITININGVNTVQGVINRINEAGAQGKGLVNVVASLSPDQKSITITDLSIQNTIINKVTSTGSLTAAFNDISVGDAVAINTFQTGSGKYIARNLDLVSKPLDTEISIIGDIESVDKEKGEISLRTENGTLYRVLSQQPVDNLFIGQSIYLNGNILPTGEFQARTVDLVSDPESGDEQIAGIIESVDTENKTINLLLGDGSRRQIEIVTQRGLIKVEDLAGGTTASDLGIQGVVFRGARWIRSFPIIPN